MVNDMDIDVRKQQMLVELLQVREECKILIERTNIFREDLLKVKTEEDALEFDRTHDLEEGLKHIRLF